VHQRRSPVLVIGVKLGSDLRQYVKCIRLN
jgi:hypothetical protein